MSGFATVGEVYDDGLTLIFDGEEEPTEKHYKCNTSVIFHAGDRVRILEDSGTFVVEYVVGVPMDPDSELHGLPTGGSTGQVLTKSGSGNYVVKWQDVVAKSVANQIDATSATYAIQLRTTSKYGSKPVFQIRMGSSGTWYTLTTE